MTTNLCVLWANDVKSRPTHLSFKKGIEMLFGMVAFVVIIFIGVLIWNLCEWIAQKLGK